MGRPRHVLIVDDDQGELFVDSQGELQRRPAVDEAGQITARYELPRYHYQVTEKHKPVGKRKPFKRDDNWIDDARYIWRAWGPPASEPTIPEVIEEQLPEPLRNENAGGKDGTQMVGLPA